MPSTCHLLTVQQKQQLTNDNEEVVFESNPVMLGTRSVSSPIPSSFRVDFQTTANLRLTARSLNSSAFPTSSAQNGPALSEFIINGKWSLVEPTQCLVFRLHYAAPSMASVPSGRGGTSIAPSSGEFKIVSFCRASIAVLYNATALSLNAHIALDRDDRMTILDVDNGLSTERKAADGVKITDSHNSHHSHQHSSQHHTPLAGSGYLPIVFGDRYYMTVAEATYLFSVELDDSNYDFNALEWAVVQSHQLIGMSAGPEFDRICKPLSLNSVACIVLNFLSSLFERCVSGILDPLLSQQVVSLSPSDMTKFEQLTGKETTSHMRYRDIMPMARFESHDVIFFKSYLQAQILLDRTWVLVHNMVDSVLDVMKASFFADVYLPSVIHPRVKSITTSLDPVDPIQTILSPPHEKHRSKTIQHLRGEAMHACFGGNAARRVLNCWVCTETPAAEFSCLSTIFKIPKDEAPVNDAPYDSFIAFKEKYVSETPMFRTSGEDGRSPGITGSVISVTSGVSLGSVESRGNGVGSGGNGGDSRSSISRTESNSSSIMQRGQRKLHVIFMAHGMGGGARDLSGFYRAFRLFKLVSNQKDRPDALEIVTIRRAIFEPEETDVGVEELGLRFAVMVREQLTNLAIDASRSSLEIRRVSTDANRTLADASKIQTESSKSAFKPSPLDSIGRISFIGHSLGGLIIRAALEHLHEYSHLFGVYMSLSTQHLGLKLKSTVTNNRIFTGGLWILKSFKALKHKFITQLSLADKEPIDENPPITTSSRTSINYREPYLVRLANQSHMMALFQHVYLVSSAQDSYCPYESARIEANESSHGELHARMARNIMDCIIPERITRLDVHFKFSSGNLDAIVGRMAHILCLDNQNSINSIVHASPEFWF